jgi:hypothetical protein
VSNEYSGFQPPEIPSTHRAAIYQPAAYIDHLLDSAVEPESVG